MNRERGNITARIMEKIELSEPHSVFFISDFTESDSPETIRKILFQATLEKKLYKVGHGIYVKPKLSRFGEVPVPLEKIALEIAQRDRCNILPSGATAANIIGLSTQVSMNLSFLTTGSTRTIRLGDRRINFRHGAPRNFAAKGQIVPILIQGMKEVGENNLTENDYTAITTFIEKNPDPYIDDDIHIAPVWIQRIIRKLTKNES